MSDTLTHRPEVGVHREPDGTWTGACACGVWFTGDSRSEVRLTSRAHYNLADQDEELPFPTGKTVAISTITDTGSVIITAFVDGEPVTIDENHPNFPRIMQALHSNGDIGPLLSTAVPFIDLGAEVTVRDDGVYYGNWKIHSNLAHTIRRYHIEGRASDNLVKFMERLMRNPSENSREQLFNWAQSRDLTIDTEGCIIAFKAVQDDMMSQSSGHAFVDGIEYNGRIPHAVGSVVSMPREEVTDNPGVACHTGLHVGTHRYATGFGPVIVKVKIDPADCVSVPRDSQFEKMRVCRYEVLEATPRETVRESDLWRFEPPAQAFDDAFDALAEEVPDSWLGRLRERFTSGRRAPVTETPDDT